MFMKRISKILLAAVLTFGMMLPLASACTDDSGLYKTDLANARVWTESAGTKIFQNGEYEKSGGTLSVAMARNESEGAQIQIHAKEDIKAFDVEVSDLYSSNAKISKEDVSVYVEKYVKIENKSNTLDEFFYDCMVPDALLPIDTSIAYGENHVLKGNNQGVYVEVETQEETPSGVYKGEATVYMDNTRCIIPIEVTVWDFALPNEPSMKSYWNMANWREAMFSDEYDCSDEMRTVYFEQMLEYGINCELPFSGIGGTEKYVELLRKYYHHEGFSSYRLYYEYEFGVYGDEICYFDYKALKEYLKAVAKASVEDKTNYLDKAFFYLLSVSGIDEPQTKEHFEKVERVSKVYGQVLQSTDEELKQELAGNSDYSYYLDTVSQTLLNIPNILTISKRMPDMLGEVSDDNFTYCPRMDLCNYSEDMDFYKSQNDAMWWYTCTGPQNPYPSTHIDDYSVNARVIGWMTRDFGADGYLNWAFALSKDYTTTQIGNWSNGDGWIAYPGHPYGIEGFVPSMRLIAMRDGMEDYEYLKLFEEKYAEAGLDAETALQAFYDRLYSGTMVKCDETEFNKVRIELAETLAGLDTADYIYNEIKIHGATATVKLYTPDKNAEILYKGEKIVGVNGHYEINVDISASQELVFTYKNGAKEYEVKKLLCGAYVSADSMDTKDNLFVASFSAADVNTDANYAKKGNSAKLTLQGKETGGENYNVYFHLNGKLFENGDISKVSSITLYIYNAEEERIDFSVFAYTGTQEVPMQKVSLTSGWNEVVITNVDKVDADSIQRLVFKTENYYEANGGKVFYIDEVSYIKTTEAE